MDNSEYRWILFSDPYEVSNGSTQELVPVSVLKTYNGGM